MKMDEQLCDPDAVTSTKEGPIRKNLGGAQSSSGPRGGEEEHPNNITGVTAPLFSLLLLTYFV
jgi:hypothetical protein